MSRVVLSGGKYKRTPNSQSLKSWQEITVKMDAKQNDRNEHELKKSSLTSSPLFSRPLISLVFPVLKSNFFLIEINPQGPEEFHLNK